MADRSQRGSTAGLTADELEQRQRADGTWEPATTVGPDDEVRSPDQIEQRQRLDGTFEGADDDEDVEGPLSPDVLEQRQVVEDDDAEDRPTD